MIGANAIHNFYSPSFFEIGEPDSKWIPVHAQFSNQIQRQGAESEECDGFNNFIVDVGIVSYTIGVISGGFGIYSLILSLLHQIIAYGTAYLISVPSSILTILTLPPPPNPTLNGLNTKWGILSALDVVVNIFGGLPFNDYVNFLSVIGEFLGAVSLLIGFGSTFPDIFEKYLEIFLGIKPHDVFSDYGCGHKAYYTS